jgi:hypothetical protein
VVLFSDFFLCNVRTYPFRLEQTISSVTETKGLQLKITDAITTADTEHVVYFLLTAYVETLDYYDPLRSSLPEHVKRLPMAGVRDVAERLRALSGSIEQYAQSQARLLIEEVLEVFSAALQRLKALQKAHQFIRSWLSLSLTSPHLQQTTP